MSYIILNANKRFARIRTGDKQILIYYTSVLPNTQNYHIQSQPRRKQSQAVLTLPRRQPIRQFAFAVLCMPSDNISPILFS